MSCQVEQIADCGDILSLGRALFVPEKEDTAWLQQCSVSLSPCGNLLAVAYRNRLCILTSQWISSTDSNSFLISWSGTLPAEITVLLALSICPSHHSSQNGPDWFCIIVGFKNGCVGFYTNTGHQLLLEKLDEKPVMKISCHTGTYGTLPDDIHILFQTCECVISGSSLFQTLRNAKAQIAKGIQDGYSVDSRNISIRKWSFTEQDAVSDAAVVGLELKNTYDHLLAASTYGGYDVWYRSVPPVNTLVLGTGVNPYIGFHYAMEGGNAPPLQDVARAVAHKIKSALPGWLSGTSTEKTSPGSEPSIRAESLSMRCGVYDAQRQGTSVAVSPDRRLAAFTDGYGRVAILDVNRGHLIRLIKGCRDAQCAFVQIFENDDKKPQLSTIKDVKRALFLIIYNPKKGLIDIRLMQRGNRVAVFTATKNGQLLYNTCGLVGAEKNYTYKKLNLPEFQCVLIDSDGKLKKIHIPFFYALEGEHSQKSKDLQTLREFRDNIKKSAINDENSENLLRIVSEIQTMDIKKHCLDLLVKKYEVPPKFIMSCLEIFWDSFDVEGQNDQTVEIKHYYANLALVTLFFRLINNENTEDMQELTSKIHQFLEEEKGFEFTECTINDDQMDSFHLLEDDNCILERLLTLAQEKDYKDQQHARVKFADDHSSSYKDFVSCFQIEETSKFITLKPETTSEKRNNLAAITFKSIFRMTKLNMLNNFVKECRVDPKEIIKLLIMQLMNTSLEEISLDMIEKLIVVLYYLCSVTDEATNITYNEVSQWWQGIRDILVDMSCPLKSMIVAMACKSVSKMFEANLERDDDSEVWESVTKENAKWGLLIGKLEDISILSIVLMFKDTFFGKSLPKLQPTDYSINLKYVYTRGKGSVTELIAKWLCGMGVLPEAIVANELIEIHDSKTEDSEETEEDDAAYIFVENNRIYVDENPKIFKWLSLLRRQFPLSTSADYIIANMCWEYAIAWQKSFQTTELLDAVIHCLVNISDLHIKLGLFSIIWSTYIKHSFEVSCRLVNKIGRLPKDSFSIQDLGTDNVSLLKFLELAVKYLDSFLKYAAIPPNREKQKIEFEKIWDESLPSLVEVAQNTKLVNNDILILNYQISCTIYYQCHFNLKFSKPLDTLYDIDYQYILEALTGNVVTREINMKASEKLRNPRMKFLTKLIRSAVETISSDSDCDGPDKTYNSEECTSWIEKIVVLADLWSVDSDFMKCQQVIALYHMGYDALTESIIHLIEKPELVLSPILAITIQRLKRSLEHSSNQPEWIVTVPPQLYKRLQNTVLDTSIPAHPSLATTILALRNITQHMAKKAKHSPEDMQNMKLAELIIENCEVLIRRKL